jgi:hypothetical protein
MGKNLDFTFQAFAQALSAFEPGLIRPWVMKKARQPQK